MMTTTESAQARDEAQLRQLIADQMSAICAKDLDRLMNQRGETVVFAWIVLADATGLDRNAGRARRLPGEGLRQLAPRTLGQITTEREDGD